MFSPVRFGRTTPVQYPQTNLANRQQNEAIAHTASSDTVQFGMSDNTNDADTVFNHQSSALSEEEASEARAEASAMAHARKHLPDRIGGTNLPTTIDAALDRIEQAQPGKSLPEILAEGLKKLKALPKGSPFPTLPEKSSTLIPIEETRMPAFAEWPDQAIRDFNQLFDILDPFMPVWSALPEHLRHETLKDKLERAFKPGPSSKALARVDFVLEHQRKAAQKAHDILVGAIAIQDPQRQ